MELETLRKQLAEVRAGGTAKRAEELVYQRTGTRRLHAVESVAIAIESRRERNLRRASKYSLRELLWLIP